MIKVSGLYVYPVKSLGAVRLQSVNITDRGFEHDRRWMLIDASNRFLTQREHAAMALLQVNITDAGLKIFKSESPGNYVIVPFVPQTAERVRTDIWGVPCEPLWVSAKVDKWFSDTLQINCRLVYMDDSTNVLIEEKYNPGKQLTSFSDGYPILMTSEASLKNLNEKSGEAVPMDRFRSNLIISGCDAFEENTMGAFLINNLLFKGVKPSARCVVTTINQSTAVKGKEPLKTLASYRSINNKIYFGENVIAASSTGTINVGDTVSIVSTKQDILKS